MKSTAQKIETLAAAICCCLSLGIASTANAASITSNGTGGGAWSAPATWAGGTVPAAGDDVTIANGDTVTIDTNVPASGSLSSLTVGQGTSGALSFDATGGRSVSVSGNVSVAAGGAFVAAGSVTNTMTIGGDLTNANTFDMAPGGSALCNVTFNKNGNQTISGAGATTNFYQIALNMGTSNANVCEVTSSNFTAPAAGFLTPILNGTLKISGSFALSNPVFLAPSYVIPATGGIWLNNINASVTGQNGLPTNNGLLRVTSGIYNIGTLGTNVMGAGTGARFIVEGGTVNVAGRLTSANPVTYTQSSGTTNICTAGGCATSPTFGFTSTAPTNVFNMSGGTINMVNSNTLATADWNTQGVFNYTGGTVQFGTGATATNFTFTAQGNMPAVTVDNTTNNKTMRLSATGFVYGNVLITSGASISPQANILDMLGATFTNNGTYGPGIPTFATGRLQFAGNVPQTYTGTGTFGTSSSPLFAFASLNRNGGVTIDPAAQPIYVARLLAFSGPIFNANMISITQITTNVVTCQRGGVGNLPAGSIDVTPSFTGTSQNNIILVYSQATTAVTTGPEVPSSRTVESIQLFNTNGLTVAGGPITVTGNGAAAPDTIGLFLGGTAAGTAGGPLFTSSANLITLTGTSATGALAGGSANSFVVGPLARTLPASLASGTTYLFPVGKSRYKAFELVNPTTTAGGTVTVVAEAFDGDSGGTAGAGIDDLVRYHYWNATLSSGAANFINSSVRVTDINSTGIVLGQSSTQGGSYASIGGTLLPATVLSTTPVTSLDYFGLGRATGTPTFLGGTYTVGTGGNYATLTAAMADLTGKIITGPVTYSLLSTYSSAGETFPIVVPRNGGSGPASVMTVKPDSGTIATISGSSASSIIRVNDSYVTIDGSNSGGTDRSLTIQNTNAATLTAAAWVSSSGANAGATDVTIKNCNIRPNGGGAGTTVSIFGIFAGGTAVGTNGDNNDNLVIQNNQIDTSYEAIAVRVSTVLNGANYGLNINNNTIGSATAANYNTFRSIELIGAVAPIVTQNEIFNQITATLTTNCAGIELGSTVYYGQVTRNKIHDLQETNSGGWGMWGIVASTSTNNFSNRIINNAVGPIVTYGFSSIGNGSACGIRLLGGADYRVYYNSVLLAGAQTSATAISAAMSLETTAMTGLDVRDNILVNNLTGGAKAYDFYSIAAAQSFGTSSGLGFGTINNNDYYGTGSANNAGFLNFWVSDVTTLNAWRGETQGDLNSVTGNPQYVGGSDLHINTGIPTVVESGGTPIPGITIDLEGNLRNATTPDLGAYEGNYTPLIANDMGAAAFIFPTNGGGVIANMAFSPQASFTNFGTAPQNNVTVRYRILDNTSTEVYNNTQVIASIAAGQTVTVTFAPVGGGLAAGSYTIKARSELAGDQNPPNDEITGSITAQNPLNGTYTVGTSGNYPTITAAVSALNSFGVSGPVVLSLIDPGYMRPDLPTTETYPITINQIAGASATNTITMKPAAGNTVTITGSSASALFVLNGTSYFTIDGSNNGTSSRNLTITNNNTGVSSAVIWLQTTSGGTSATNNVIKNVNLVGNSNTTTLVGVGSGSSTISVTSTGISNNNNTFQNCNISKTQYGIYSGGQSAANKNTGNVITQNVINAASPNNVEIGGILVKFENGIQITQNNIANINMTTGAFGIGLGLGDSITNILNITSGSDVTNATVSRNQIDNVVSTSATGFTAVGVIVAPVTSGTNQIANNMISRVVSQATPADATMGIFAMGGAGSTTQIYFNSISMTGSRGTATNPSYAIAIASSNPIVDVRNNIFYNTQSGTSTGKMYAIGTASATFTNMTSNYNDLFVSGVNAFVGQTGGLGTSGTDRATLLDWQTATGTDANSISADPLFVSVSNLHVSCGSPAIAAGIAIAGITTDFDGDTRPGIPTIGADEPVAPQAVSAASRKMHGGAGTFDIDLPLSTPFGVESRSGGGAGNYEIVVNFASPVTVTSAMVTSGIGSVVTATGNGTTTITVDLTGVTTAQYITVTLFCVNDGVHSGNVPVSMGVLVGDVNANTVVNAADVALTKSQLGQPVGAGNFRADLNANGTINAADTAIVKSNLGTSLPP